MANLNLNRVILGGRLTADPTLRKTANDISVASFTIAVNRRATNNEQAADFIDCVAWRANADFICKYFGKGSSIAIEGSLQKRKYENNNGETRYITEVIVDRSYFVDGKGENITTSTASGKVIDTGFGLDTFPEDEVPW